ncbi:hypothetical protein H5410_044841, partial [Solanum commersonii]
IKYIFAIILESENQENKKCSFKFENWWLKVERKKTLLHDLAELELAQDNRVLTEDEMVVRATNLVDLEMLAKNEESIWIMSSAHRRYNTVDRFVSRGVEIKEPGEVK